jgi:molybdate transport system substrate-binding protein
MTLSFIRYGLVLLMAVSTACSRPPARQTLTIAAAADLNFALEEIAREFRNLHPAIDLRIAYGSSGNFYSQIVNGAPFDIFLSADAGYPRRLRAPDVFLYAAGGLVVWVGADSGLDPATALRDPAVKHIAIANPNHAPYGRAAEAALRKMGLWTEVEPKLVYGENVAQTLQFVKSGAAEAGIVARSLAMAPQAGGRYWEVPRHFYPRMDQGGLVLKDSAGARAFRDFLLAEPGRSTLKRFGFSLPGEVD